ITSPNQKRFNVKSSLSARNILLSFSRNTWLSPPHPESLERDVSRSSRTLDTGGGGREGAQRGLPRRRKHCSRTSEIVRSRRPDAGVKFLARRSRGAMVANKPGTPGRPRISRKPSRRGCRLIWLPCCCLRAQSALPFARKAHGCGLHPAFPAPSSLRGSRSMHHSGAHTPRECKGVSDPQRPDQIQLHEEAPPITALRLPRPSLASARLSWRDS